MKIRRHWPIQWFPHQTESCFTMNNGFSRTKIIRISTRWFFTAIRICVGLGHICPTPGEIGLRRNNIIIWAHEFCTFATRYAYLSCILMIIKMNDELENQRLKTYPSLYELWLKRWNIDDGMQVTGWCITYIQIA